MNQKAMHSLQKTWTKLGTVDPLWAILSDPAKENGQWQLNDFFDTGTTQLQALQNELSHIGNFLEKERCLDFGCGIGRMSRAFSSIFKMVHGVDIASSMIKEAKKHHQNFRNIEFHLNEKNDLALFPDNHFDFIFSHIVLQHMPPMITKNYIREFVRVLKPGGLIAFQLPSHIRRSYENPAFNATITCHVETGQYPPDTKISINATVTNIGEATWSSRQSDREQFRLGNHWCDTNGRVLIHDDGRCDIPHLAPGDSCDLILEITTPSSPGKYLLGLDIVQEHVTWFENAGSTVTHVPVEIVAANTARNVTAPPKFNNSFLTRLIDIVKRKFPVIKMFRKPEYEMHGIEKEAVIELLTRSGAKIIKVRDDSSAGPNWKSYYYFAGKI